MNKHKPGLKLNVRSVVDKVELSEELSLQEVVVERSNLVVVEHKHAVVPIRELGLKLLSTTSDAGLFLGIAGLLLDVSSDGVGHFFIKL